MLHSCSSQPPPLDLASDGVPAGGTRSFTVADSERHRIERDLHDGAQQRLVALRIHLELAAEGSDGDQADLLRKLGREVELIIDELRALASGIYPVQLTGHGLAVALRSAALHAALPVTVRPGPLPRYPADVEHAVYFACLEAVQNAAKHAGAGASVVVVLRDVSGVLHAEVRDNGAGFDTDGVAPGMGIANMVERIASVHGDLTISSSIGGGTRVRAVVPGVPG